MIQNGKDKPIGQASAGLPNVSDAVMSFLQPVRVGIIKASQIKGYTQTVVTKFIFTQGARIQNANNLVITKAGERIWDSMDVYFLSDIVLAPDDLFLFGDTQYRVLVVEDWTEYGYNKYSVLQDYTKLDSTDAADM